jgi:hypothetical protein
MLKLLLIFYFYGLPRENFASFVELFLTMRLINQGSCLFFTQPIFMELLPRPGTRRLVF